MDSALGQRPLRPCKGSLSGDPFGGLMERVVRQMGVERGRLDIALVEQLADCC